MITYNEQIQERINQQSAQMTENYREHLAECRAYGGPVMAAADDHHLFESWAIQKIAALQVLVMELNDQLTALRR